MNEEFRRQPPPPLPPKPLSIPTPYETRLANGMHVVIVEDSRVPLVSYRLAFPTGDAHDPTELPGLTDVMAAMLTEGTESRTSRQIADEVARYGATITAGANSDYTTVAASSLAQYADPVLDLLADVALRPEFPENELALLKQNTKQGLIAQRGQASFLANERVARVIFGSHPYATVAPTPESIDRMTRGKLTSFHRTMIIPNSGVLLIVGDVKRAVLLKRIDDLFGKWPAGEPATAKFPALPARTERTIYLVDRPGSAQSNIVIASAGLTRTNPDHFPVLTMNTILGGTASARLFMNLREEKGYTYGAYSTWDMRRDAGSFRATAEVRAPVTGDSLKEFFYELNRIRDEAVPEKELNDAKSYLTGVFPIRLETQEGLIEQLVQIKMFNLPADYLQVYRERVNAVTSEDAQRVAKQYIQPDQVAIVIVGDAAAVTDQIKSFASVIEVYDSGGKRKDGGWELGVGG